MSAVFSKLRGADSPPAAPAPQAARPKPPLAPGLAAADSGSLRLPAQHFAAAILFLVVGSLGLVVVAPDVASGNFLSRRVAGVTHFFTLGWLTTTIFGALYQLLPVALGAPVRWQSVGQLGFWTYVPGAALFACGVFHGSIVLHHAGIALLTSGIVFFLVNVGSTLPRARSRDVTWFAVTLALLALLSTLVLGVVLLHNLHTGFLMEHRVRVMAVHLHVALIGWALTMMVGISHRLLPMFLLAHGADLRWTGRSLLLLQPGLVLLATGLLARWSIVSWIGLLLLEAGVVCYLVQCRAFFKARMRPALDAGLRFAVAGLCFLAVSALLAPVLLAAGGVRQPRLATGYVLVGLLGGIVLFVVGHFYKIVPFLAWIAQFRDRVGREKVPTVAELYSARVARVQLWLMTGAVSVLAAGVALAQAWLVRLAAIAFTAGVLLLVVQAVRVVRGGRIFAR